MVYRTKTYIAGDWDHDKDAVEQIYKWKNGHKWSLDFYDAHELKQARDTSLPCSIKASLKSRLDASKTFVLIVGNHTDSITKGSCQFCDKYNSYFSYCASNRTIDRRSFVKFECEKAVEANLKIVVLYNNTSIDRSKCPAAVRYLGTHATMVYKGMDGKLYWDYDSVKDALDK